MKKALLFLLVVLSLHATAQTYSDSIETFRGQYKRDFLTDAHSPLKAADTGFLRFFAPNKKYRVAAIFTATPDAKSFQIQTHSGQTRPYRQYGYISFSLGGKKLKLEVYQALKLMQVDSMRDYLFLPFNDLTNYATTFGGGRYLDLKIGEIKDGKLLLDFNKCYNPYCAFAGGYSCPIPPDANKLPIAIKAGEQLFGKAVKE